MSESYASLDLETLRAIARGQGIDGAQTMEHDDLVTALRDAGLGEPPSGPAADPAGNHDHEPALYHGLGVGRRETVDGTDEAGSPGGPSGDESASPGAAAAADPESSGTASGESDRPDAAAGDGVPTDRQAG